MKTETKPETRKERDTEMKIEMWKIEDVKPYDRNPRVIPDSAVEAVAESIRQFGFQQPIVVDAGGFIICGHTRWKAARLIGLAEVPVHVADNLTPEEVRAYRIADNKLGELSKWNADILPIELADLRGLGVNLGVLGFSEKDLAGLIPPDVADGLTDPDDVPDPPAEPITQPGDIWLLGDHRLMCGDSTKLKNVDELMAGEKCDVLFADPPYCSGGFQEAGRSAGSVGTRGDELVHNDTLSSRGYIAMMKQALGNAPVGIVYLFTDWRMWANLFDVVESCGFGVRNMIVWDKESPGMGCGWRMQHELILCGISVKSPFNPQKVQGNVIQCKRTGNKLHATEKPTELISKVLDVTDLAKTVYDPFLGSGTTIIACEQLGRKCYAMEISPHYCDVAVKRWEEYTGREAERVIETEGGD